MKGKSPFYPGQPVPIEFFIGRSKEVERINAFLLNGYQDDDPAVWAYGFSLESKCNCQGCGQLRPPHGPWQHVPGCGTVCPLPSRVQHPQRPHYLQIPFTFP